MELGLLLLVGLAVWGFMTLKQQKEKELIRKWGTTDPDDAEREEYPYGYIAKCWLCGHHHEWVEGFSRGSGAPERDNFGRCTECPDYNPSAVWKCNLCGDEWDEDLDADLVNHEWGTNKNGQPLCPMCPENDN